MKTFAERFAHAMRAKGLTQKQLSQATGIQQGTISAYYRGFRKSPRAEHASALAKALAVDMAWLSTGDGITPPNSSEPLPRERGSLASSVATNAMFTVPLIRWSHAATWKKMTMSERSANTLKVMRVAHQFGKDAFAVTFTGDSMTSAMEPRSIPDGSTVVIDPDVTPEHGAVVFATVAGVDKLRSLWVDGATQYLRAINPSSEYPKEPLGEGIIHGVAVMQFMEKSLWPVG